MKPTFIIFKALLPPAFLLGVGALLHAEPQAIPRPSEKSEGVQHVNDSHDPFAVVDPSEGSDPFAAADPTDLKPQPPLQVQIQVEFIEMSHKALTKLLFLANPDATNGTALRTKLQAMVETGEAEVLDTQVVVSKSGQRSINESIHEFIYPTEYEGPRLPSFSGSSGPSPLERASIITGENAIPTAFATRNLGGSLVVEPAFGEGGRLVELQLVPELVWHTGNTIHLEKKDALGHVSKVEMPDIYAIRLDTTVTCVAGQYLMASVLSPKNANGEVDMTRKVMVFVKCDVLSVR
jgi:hypothetical protein